MIAYESHLRDKNAGVVPLADVSEGFRTLFAILNPFQSTKLINTAHISVKRPTNKWTVVSTVFGSIIPSWSVKRMTCYMHKFLILCGLGTSKILTLVAHVSVTSQLKRNKEIASTCLDTLKIYAILNLGNQAIIFLYGETS